MYLPLALLIYLQAILNKILADYGVSIAAAVLLIAKVWDLIVKAKRARDTEEVANAKQTGSTWKELAESLERTVNIRNQELAQARSECGRCESELHACYGEKTVLISQNLELRGRVDTAERRVTELEAQLEKQKTRRGGQ